MVGHGEDQRERVFGRHVALDDAAGKGLGDGIGGDEAEAAQQIGLGPRALAGQALGGGVPKVHDEIGATGQVRAGLPGRFRIAVAQFGAHVLAANKRRITDDEVHFGPVGRAGIAIGVELDTGLRVGHQFAGYGMIHAGDAIPAGDGGAGLVAQRILAVIGKDRILLNDSAIAMQHRLGNRGDAGIAQLPFQIADPEDEIGNGHGARIEFEAVELMRIDGFTLHLETGFVLAQFLDGFEDFALKFLEKLQRDIQEIARAAGGVEHFDSAEFVVESAGNGEGRLVVAGAQRIFDFGLGAFPIGAEGLDDSGDHKALDIGAGRIMGAELGALARIERAFKQGAENGGFDIAPILFGGNQQLVNILGRQG